MYTSDKQRIKNLTRDELSKLYKNSSLKYALHSINISSRYTKILKDRFEVSGFDTQKFDNLNKKRVALVCCLAEKIEIYK
jgi:hypothetical protein